MYNNVREAKKSGGFPTFLGARNPKPTGPTEPKIHFCSGSFRLKNVFQRCHIPQKLGLVTKSDKLSTYNYIGYYYVLVVFTRKVKMFVQKGAKTQKMLVKIGRVNLQLING